MPFQIDIRSSNRLQESQNEIRNYENSWEHRQNLYFKQVIQQTDGFVMFKECPTTESTQCATLPQNLSPLPERLEREEQRVRRQGYNQTLTKCDRCTESEKNTKEKAYISFTPISRFNISAVVAHVQ